MSSESDFPGGTVVKDKPANGGDARDSSWVRSLVWEDALEQEVTIHSSIFPWEIPWTVEPGGLQSMGSQRVRHDSAHSVIRKPVLVPHSPFYRLRLELSSS